MAGYQTTVSYADGVGFVYDPTFVEFVAGAAKLKNLCCPDATCYAGYDTSIDLNWGDGVLAGSAVGGAVVAGGWLDLRGGGVRYVEYSAAGNAQSAQTLCIRFMFRPNYSGAPTTHQTYVSIGNSGPWRQNYVSINQHPSNGNIRILICSSTAAYLLVDYLGAWLVTAGQEYEIEANIDITNGETRLFIDGVQFGATKTTTGTRDTTSDLLRVGTNRTQMATSDFEIRDLVIFDTVQHVANYTAPSPLPSPTPYTTTCPVVLPMAATWADALYALEAVVSEPGADAVGWLASIDGTYHWYDGIAWVPSAGGYAESNSPAEVTAHATELDISAGAQLKWGTILRSADGTSTPTVTSHTYEYDFHIPTPGMPGEVTVYGWLEPGYVVRVTWPSWWYGARLMPPGGIDRHVTDGDGYFELILHETSTTRQRPYTVLVRQPGAPPLQWYTDCEVAAGVSLSLHAMCRSGVIH